MDLGIAGKVAMVAAGSKGIGLATAQILAEEGCLVSICSRSQSNLDLALPMVGPNAVGFVCDVSNLADLERWYEHTRDAFGKVSILMTNTGGPPAGPVASMTDAQWQAGFDSTFMNVVRLTRLVSEDMTSSGWGRIVHLTSHVAKEPSLMLPISSTLRAGIMALTRIQAAELGPFGITVNGVLPGNTMTERQIHLAEVTSAAQGGSVQEALDAQSARVPRGRMGEPRELGAAVAFLCSQQAAFISGVNLLVDGGAMKGIA